MLNSIIQLNVINNIFCGEEKKGCHLSLHKTDKDGIPKELLKS